MAITIGNIVHGAVINDYGLDNVLYTVGTTGITTSLLAFVGWDVATSNYQSSGKAPAVNVTDSASNLWRQIGISTAATEARGSIWIADNPTQTEWVSVSLTGWGNSTSYMICEMDGLPSTYKAIALDFVQTVNNTNPATSLTLAASASTTDIALGLVVGGGTSGTLNVPSGWTSIGLSPTAVGTATEAVAYAMWIGTVSSGAVPSFAPTWAGSVPSAGIIVGLKQTATQPTQTNPNMPNVTVEAAFGATPGDYTQSVDYTWDVEGITWTDISSRCFSKGDDAKISVKSGRQYELSQEEAGEIDITLDNHDGAFTYGNLASPYYSNALNANMSFQNNLIPWTPINSATIVQSTTATFASGYQPFITAQYSCKLTCAASANPGIQSELIAINQGFQYSYSAWFYSTVGYSTGIQIGIEWYNASKVFISTGTYSLTTLPAGVWTQTSVQNASPPAGAAFAQIFPQLDGTPGSNVVFYIAEAALVQGGQLVRTGCLVPETPLRVTAWFGGNGGSESTQYPIGFGYVERWPQDWPDMPQWGFASIVAVNAFGPMSSVNLPSSVEGEVRKEVPYAYFTTSEQYEFTSQSLTPTASPIDANGLIAVNDAFGNNRYGAYRDGTSAFGNSIPVTTGQALNLLGDENTSLGVTTYSGQAVESDGPGMFYFDPNIPTNFAANSGFSLDFWFVWGNTNTFSCELFSAFGRPSAFYAPAPETAPTNGGVIAVGVNTALPGATVVTSGFYCNGVELTNGAFDQTTFSPQHFALTTGPNGPTTYLNGVATANQPGMGTIPQIRAFTLGPGRFSYDQSNMVAYNAYNYNAGHLAWYGEELTGIQVLNHYEAGISGWVGVSASGRFAQALTWGGLGLKRGGTAWFGTYGQPEGTYMSEAYDYEGSSAADIMGELAQSEGGRCYAQANGSVVYVYRWTNYNQSTAATFGDNGTTQLPYEQDTSFAVDNQFIYNQVQATQQRGPNQDMVAVQNSFASQTNFFLRSGLQYTSYAMLPFDVFDVVNWSIAKYQNPVERVVNLDVDVSKSSSKFANTLFPTILSLDLNNTIVVTRNPVGGGSITMAGVVQSLQHDIGATYWKTSMQVTPTFPDNNALFTDTAGYNSPNNNYLAW